MKKRIFGGICGLFSGACLSFVIWACFQGTLEGPFDHPVCWTLSCGAFLGAIVGSLFPKIAQGLAYFFLHFIG